MIVFLKSGGLMRGRVPIELMLASMMLMAGCTDRQLIRPGIGVGDLVVGVSALTAELKRAETRERYENSGISYFAKDERIISSVLVYGSSYRTERGIRVGATIDQVESAYGPGQRRTSSLMAGDTPIGKFGDFAIYHQGIAFLISKGKVVAIEVFSYSTKAH